MATETSEPVCLVTGASAGIGLATAEQFVKNGYRVAICAREPERLEKAKQHLVQLGGGREDRVHTIEFNLRTASQTGLIVDEVNDVFGRIDVLVNNAGAAVCAPITELENSDFESLISINIRAVHHLTQRSWQSMKGQGGGVIVNISSLAAVDPFQGFAVYGATKAWIDLYSKALATEGKADNIRVYSVRPGAVDTALLNRLFPDFPRDQRLQPEHVAKIIWEVCTEPFEHSSGQAIDVHNQ